MASPHYCDAHTTTTEMFRVSHVSRYFEAALSMVKRGGCELVAETLYQWLKGEDRARDSKDSVSFMLAALADDSSAAELPSTSGIATSSMAMLDGATIGRIAAFDPYGRWGAHPKHEFAAFGGKGGASTHYTIPHILQLYDDGTEPPPLPPSPVAPPHSLEVLCAGIFHVSL